jgi:hypothetical protein
MRVVAAAGGVLKKQPSTAARSAERRVRRLFSTLL